MSLTVRPITASDGETLARIHIDSWRDAYRGLLRDEYLDAEVVADRSAVWTERVQHLNAVRFGFVAEDEGRTIAFVFLIGAHDTEWGTLLDNLHVLPASRGRGVGRLLVEAAAREAIVRHPDAPIYLWVFEQNVQARRFYARLGGREAERVVRTAPDGAAIPEWRVVWPNPARLLDNVSGGD